MFLSDMIRVKFEDSILRIYQSSPHSPFSVLLQLLKFKYLIERGQFISGSSIHQLRVVNLIPPLGEVLKWSISVCLRAKLSQTIRNMSVTLADLLHRFILTPDEM
ncbi:hypothetical protein AC579_1502 [Pseudocercospora musae]|uniref:Uncharacterized protein n=1 Tax=Pseudocercospora musae TaxID=113226 RepID=A0A139IJW6_9PEZI|nr:hypothetical protein AC579_1502 [Pseudocercospora musae]